MTLVSRKMFVLSLIAGVFLLANVWWVVKWLQESGVIDMARYVKNEFLTGTTLAIIVVLLILLVNPVGQRSGLIRRCSVCNHVLIGRGSYCNECGSKQ
jgi:predicted PurR-regulated permease PerM